MIDTVLIHYYRTRSMYKVQEPNNINERKDEKPYPQLQIPTCRPRTNRSILRRLYTEQQKQLYDILNKHKPLFDESLGRMKSEPYDIKLKKDAKPYHANPFPIPHIHEAKLCAEVNRQVRIRVRTKVNDSKWRTPTWVIPKKNNTTARFLSDLRKLYKQIQGKPYPNPKSARHAA